MSATKTLPTPRRARFLRISLPSAPAPMTRILAFLRRDWSHQEMRLKRWKRSFSASRSRVILLGGLDIGKDQRATEEERREVATDERQKKGRCAPFLLCASVPLW